MSAYAEVVGNGAKTALYARGGGSVTINGSTSSFSIAQKQFTYSASSWGKAETSKSGSITVTIE